MRALPHHESAPSLKLEWATFVEPELIERAVEATTTEIRRRVMRTPRERLLRIERATRREGAMVRWCGPPEIASRVAGAPAAGIPPAEGKPRFPPKGTFGPNSSCRVR